MTRASISSLVSTLKGLSLLWIHILLLFWITISWIITLCWISSGAFRLRQAHIDALGKQRVTERSVTGEPTFFMHPHPPYTFADISAPDEGYPNFGLRSRTIMVSNVPHGLRNERELKEYFIYYMSQKLEKPSMGLTSSTQPGFLNKCFAFLLNRVKRIWTRVSPNPVTTPSGVRSSTIHAGEGTKSAADDYDLERAPMVERVVIARKMTELASLLDRREEALAQLEAAHIKLANKTLLAVRTAMDRKSANKPMKHSTSRTIEVAKQRKHGIEGLGRGGDSEPTLDEEARMNQLVDVLGPYVEEFGLKPPFSLLSTKAIFRSHRDLFRKSNSQTPEVSDVLNDRAARKALESHPLSPSYQKSHTKKTVWEALLSLPRDTLDAYQPLIRLSHLFRGKTVPAIDYYTTKLNFLTALITESRAKAVNDYDPVSTAFVTFTDPADARRACRYLAVHPNNPLACLVTMAPTYEDLDWIRVMKSSFNTEFVKDWIVNIGVWGFTLFWTFPVTLLVGLVSIQSISQFWPSLKKYLDRHAWQEEIIQSFLPTVLVAALALLIPLMLLLIAKKAHTIPTLSSLHDLIMMRYYKFLIVNVLVFFCVGTAALQSFLLSFKSPTRPDLLQIVADSFPTAGPFYVGWLIFATAIHGCFELALVGLPLLVYPTTARQTTPRKRTVGIRPRTFNYYYWLPNHLLVLHVLLLFSAFNPFVLPFGTLYYFIQAGVVKNQFIHVYAKNYEGDGKIILIRIVRYSLDGLILAQAIFLAYMVVLKKSANVGLSAFLIISTVITKIIITRMCRAQFEAQDIEEAQVLCKYGPDAGNVTDVDVETIANNSNDIEENGLIGGSRIRSTFMTWRLPAWINFSYGSFQRRNHRLLRRKPIPFNSTTSPTLSQLRSTSPLVDAQPVVASSVADIPKNVPETRGPRFVNDSACDDVSNNLQQTGPVVPHQPPCPWDDQTMADRPYDNPYYVRPIDKVLWLPRDPCNTLDLDDTVDMKVSLTVDVSAGKLGAWFSMQDIPNAPPVEPTRDSSTGLAPESQQPKGLTPSLFRPDGTEDIDLPEIIAKRVKSREVDVQQASLPRLIHSRKVSSHPGTSPTDRERRPSIFVVPPPVYARSYSEGERPGGTQSPSAMSALQPPLQIRRCRSSDVESGLRPDTHAQLSLVAMKLQSAENEVQRAHNVSAHQAIYHEVLAEEEEALIDRLEEEKAEEDKAKTAKSWWTSWMFNRTE
ncbi:hypothetical protein AX17_006208 [Amanita inopinata Kibby_2008]|nr:hypothetical protein AX17_006208 [Amanita inopinata Kibby_2008]